MSEDEFLDYRQPENDELDSEFRIVLVKQNFNKEDEANGIEANSNVDESDLEERMLSSIKTFTKINDFFDKFDTEIAYPNESDIKYDVGSDGLIVIVVNNDTLKAKVLKFVDEYLENELKLSQESDVASGDDKQSKKQKK